VCKLRFPYSVVFPLPLAPIMAVRLPLGMSTDMSSKIEIDGFPDSVSFGLDFAGRIFLKVPTALELGSTLTDKFRICLGDSKFIRPVQGRFSVHLHIHRSHLAQLNA
jgi:hypothetical protein